MPLAFEQASQGRLELVEGRVVGRRTGPDHQIRRGPGPVGPGEPAAAGDLPEPAPEAVPGGRGASVARDDHGQTRAPARRGCDEGIERAGPLTAAPTEDPTDVGAGADARSTGEPLSRGRGTRAGQRVRRFRRLSSLTVRRCRPFFRRRASTFRPAFVFMRARKPWSRIRFRLLGFRYVGCIGLWGCGPHAPARHPGGRA